jgi:hypothetical protein
MVRSRPIAVQTGLDHGPTLAPSADN